MCVNLFENRERVHSQLGDKHCGTLRSFDVTHQLYQRNQINGIEWMCNNNLFGSR